MVALEALGPFCISSPQSRGKGIRSPPAGRRRGVFPKSQTPAAHLRSGPSLSTSSKGSGHGRREALAPNGPELGTVEGGGEEPEEPV